MATGNVVMYAAAPEAEKAEDLCNHFLFMDITKAVQTFLIKAEVMHLHFLLVGSHCT